MTSVVRKRVKELKEKIPLLATQRGTAYEDMLLLVKRRQKAIASLAHFSVEKPNSRHKRSVQIKVKMSKKTYASIRDKVQWKFAEKYVKKRHLLRTDVTDTFKALVCVNNFQEHLTEKINALTEELAHEFNSEAWNTLIHDRRLQYDSGSYATSAPTPPSAMIPKPISEFSKARSKAKAKAQGRGGRGRSADIKEIPAPGTPPRLLETLPEGLLNFEELEVKTFKGPWRVNCDAMHAEASVSADGRFEMHQKTKPGSNLGWSAMHCQILRDYAAGTFVTSIDGVKWTCASVDMDYSVGGKSTVIWRNPGNPDSVWSRTKRDPNDRRKEGAETAARIAPVTPVERAAPKAKPKAKSQVRTNAQPLTPISDVNSNQAGVSPLAGRGLSAGPASPIPAPVEWYTEMRNGRLMWTDGISAVPAEERVTDDHRQKTKMQF